MQLFPDLSTEGKAYARWNSVADQLRKQGYQISTSDYLESRGNDQQRKKGLDFADFLLMPASPPKIVTTLADWAAHPGSILRPDKSMLVFL